MTTFWNKLSAFCTNFVDTFVDKRRAENHFACQAKRSSKNRFCYVLASFSRKTNRTFTSGCHSTGSSHTSNVCASNSYGDGNTFSQIRLGLAPVFKEPQLLSTPLRLSKLFPLPCFTVPWRALPVWTRSSRLREGDVAWRILAHQVFAWKRFALYQRCEPEFPGRIWSCTGRRR